jgi:hypothetical protein
VYHFSGLADRLFSLTERLRPESPKRAFPEYNVNCLGVLTRKNGDWELVYPAQGAPSADVKESSSLEFVLT